DNSVCQASNWASLTRGRDDDPWGAPWEAASPTSAAAVPMEQIKIEAALENASALMSPLPIVCAFRHDATEWQLRAKMRRAYDEQMLSAPPSFADGRSPRGPRSFANPASNRYTRRMQRIGKSSDPVRHAAQPQSTSSVAAASSVRGMGRPRAFAALRLMTSSNLPGP